MRPSPSLGFAAALALSGFGCFTDGNRTTLFGGAEHNEPAVVAENATPKQQELADKEAAKLSITMAEKLEKEGKDATKNKDREAIYYYERARELDPELNDRAARHLACLYDLTDQQDKAMHEFQYLIKKKPKDAALLNDFGRSYYNRGQWAEAETYLRKAVSQDKHFKPAWVNLGLALAQQDKQQEALEAFGHAISTAEAYSNLGFVLATQKRYPEALASYQRALELEPALKKAQAAVQRLQGTSPR